MGRRLAGRHVCASNGQITGAEPVFLVNAADSFARPAYGASLWQPSGTVILRALSEILPNSLARHLKLLRAAHPAKEDL